MEVLLTGTGTGLRCELSTGRSFGLVSCRRSQHGHDVRKDCDEKSLTKVSNLKFLQRIFVVVELSTTADKCMLENLRMSEPKSPLVVPNIR